MQSSCVLGLCAENNEGLAAAGSGTVYRRYLRKFICAIPRVHGGYFKSSSCIFQRVHQEGLHQFLLEGRILQDDTVVAEDVHQDGKTLGSQSHTVAGTAEVGLGLQERLEATLKTALARLWWPLDCVSNTLQRHVEPTLSSSGT